MAKKESTVKRTRNYASVVYPESAPKNWLSILEDQRIPALISPLHDSDINPNGEPKKPHYHVLLMFDSMKTVDQAREVFDLISGVGCESVKSIRGYARYLCHLDNPEKCQYDQSKVTCLCGAEYSAHVLSASDRIEERNKCIGEMMDWCDENQVYSFAVLSKYARSKKPDWFNHLTVDCAYFMTEYLKSLKWTDTKDSDSPS